MCDGLFLRTYMCNQYMRDKNGEAIPNEVLTYILDSDLAVSSLFTSTVLLLLYS